MFYVSTSNLQDPDKDSRANRKGHPIDSQVSFLYAYEVSCRARAEEAGPTSVIGDSPQIGSPAALAFGELSSLLLAIFYHKERLRDTTFVVFWASAHSDAGTNFSVETQGRS